ncbi:hypothetical protein SRHO_G00307220 [Serrasalmus rhombeus]
MEMYRRGERIGRRERDGDKDNKLLTGRGQTPTLQKIHGDSVLTPQYMTKKLLSAIACNIQKRAPHTVCATVVVEEVASIVFFPFSISEPCEQRPATAEDSRISAVTVKRSGSVVYSVLRAPIGLFF